MGLSGEHQAVLVVSNSADPKDRRRIMRSPRASKLRGQGMIDTVVLVVFATTGFGVLRTVVEGMGAHLDSVFRSML